MNINNLRSEFRKLSDPQKAKILQNFFKTKKGQYGHGDIFLGITVPITRSFAKKYLNISVNNISQLLRSDFHEERLLAVIILVEQFKTADESKRKTIFTFYFDNSKFINNWDLVDLSAPKIVGNYLFDKNKEILIDLSRSDNLWQKRISIVSTFYFIKQNDFEYTFKVAEILLNDDHDLIHKSVGWMLREAGKMDQEKEELFLKKFYKQMPRTMLRYAIEKFDLEKRQKYLKGLI